MRLLAFLSALALSLGSLSAQSPKDPMSPLTEDERILHAISRLSFGPSPGQAVQVRSIGLEAWIESQLDLLVDQELEAKLQGLYPTLGKTTAQMRAMLDARKENAGDSMTSSIADVYRESERDLRRAVVMRAALSKAQLKELLSDFWRNHLNVDSSKDTVQWVATHYEEQVIRKHTLGKFSEMLWDSAHHPAMLIYLDNSISRRPPSKSELAQIERTYRRRGSSREEAREQAQIARQRGLNENYARELMELHTLGVDNEYSQEDVEQVARAFTGWSVDLGDEKGHGFSYKEPMHDPSNKTVLGRNLPRGRGEDGMVEGHAILKMLAVHKHTANFIATKLTRYLVHDDAPPSVVAAAAQAFQKSKGDIKETMRAILKHPEFYARSNFRAKFKTPLEFVISAVRATGAEVTNPDVLVNTISQLGMPIYACEDPTGYRDTAESWRDPGVMALRWKFAIELAGGKLKGVTIPDSFFYRLPSDPLDLLETLTKRIVPNGLDENTHAVLERVIFKRVQQGATKGDDAIRALAQTIVGVLLGSPEFQQQ